MEKGSTPKSKKRDVREEMSHVPLSELKEMQEKIGLKAFNKIRAGGSARHYATPVFKRENKNRPSEVSARRPVPRNTVEVKKKISRDPRFDDLSGEFNEHIFKQSYSFVDDIKTKEKSRLKKIMSKSTNAEKKANLKKLITRLEQQEKAEKRKEKRREIDREWKKKERQKVMEGKKPFFLKKSEKKALEKAEYQKELQKSGKLKNYVERKNKKLAAKERKKQSWVVDEPS